MLRLPGKSRGCFVNRGSYGRVLIDKLVVLTPPNSHEEVTKSTKNKRHTHTEGCIRMDVRGDGDTNNYTGLYKGDRRSRVL